MDSFEWQMSSPPPCLYWKFRWIVMVPWLADLNLVVLCHCMKTRHLRFCMMICGSLRCCRPICHFVYMYTSYAESVVWRWVQRQRVWPGHLRQRRGLLCKSSWWLHLSVPAGLQGSALWREWVKCIFLFNSQRTFIITYIYEEFLLSSYSLAAAHCHIALLR